MVRTISKRIISILMVIILSVILCFALPKHQVKASIVGDMTIEIGMALIALLGAFGITVEFPDNLSDDEFLSVVGTILPINKSYAQWKQDIAITETGKIYASQDLVTQVLTKFYSRVNSMNVEFNPVSSAAGATNATIYYDAIDTRNLSHTDDSLFMVGQTINVSNLQYLNGTNFYNYLYLNRESSDYCKLITDVQWNSIKEYLTNDSLHHFSKHFYYQFYVVQTNGRAIVSITFKSINTMSVGEYEITKVQRDNGRWKYSFKDTLDNSTNMGCVRVTFNPDGTTNFTTTTFSYLYSGFFSNALYGTYLASNLGWYGSYAYLSQTSVLNRFWDVANNTLLTDRILSYIGSAVGLSIVQSATVADSISIGLADDAIDYPLSGTGVVVDTGVIAQELDGWVEGVQEKVVTTDIPSENESTRTRDFEISKVIASPTALDFTDTADYAVEESLPATYSANNNLTLLNGLGSFFPFCIPFDLYTIFQGFNAPAQVPIFNWSIDFRSFGMGKHEFVIDLSDFETVCLIFKIMTFIAFLIFLTLKTRDLIRG